MALGPGVPDPPLTNLEHPRPNSRHRRGKSYAVRVNPIFGGLHHEYFLAKRREHLVVTVLHEQIGGITAHRRMRNVDGIAWSAGSFSPHVPTQFNFSQHGFQEINVCVDNSAGLREALVEHNKSGRK